MFTNNASCLFKEQLLQNIYKEYSIVPEVDVLFGPSEFYKYNDMPVDLGMILGEER